jgi:hypothetical protein
MKAAANQLHYPELYDLEKPNQRAFHCIANNIIMDALSHMRLVVAVGVGTMGPLSCWVTSSAAELIKQPTIANVCS